MFPILPLFHSSNHLFQYPNILNFMLSRKQIQFIRSLHQKKYRALHRLFIAEGPKVVSELLNSPNYSGKIKEMFATKEFAEDSKVSEVCEVSPQELKQISLLTTPNQVLAVVESFFPKLNINSLSEKLVLALDNIRDPGNLGTIIRIADWFGITDILCSETCVDGFNPKVVQASMGALARMNLYYVNLSRVLGIAQKSSKVYAAVLNGKNIYKENLSAQGVILIGNESRGISENLMQLVTDKISIPNFSSQAGEHAGLNAAIATAIICSEFRRNKFIRCQ